MFAFLDGVINANYYAQKLFWVYKPIDRKSLNRLVGMIIQISLQ
jgi:hypothetical protein